MKKIGILFGQERSFPNAFVERINSKNIDGIVAEPVKIDKVVQGESSGYAVIIDRISQDVPFYRAFLKNAASISRLQSSLAIFAPLWLSILSKLVMKSNCSVEFNGGFFSTPLTVSGNEKISPA